MPVGLLASSVSATPEAHQTYAWQSVFIAFATMIPGVLALLPFMRTPVSAGKPELEESLGAILIKAFKDPSYTLIFLGFSGFTNRVQFP